MGQRADFSVGIGIIGSGGKKLRRIPKNGEEKKERKASFVSGPLGVGGGDRLLFPGGWPGLTVARLLGLSLIKEFLKTRFETFDSTNDLYVYFQEQEVRNLKANGRMGMIVANKSPMTPRRTCSAERAESPWSRVNVRFTVREYPKSESLESAGLDGRVEPR